MAQGPRTQQQRWRHRCFYSDSECATAVPATSTGRPTRLCYATDDEQAVNANTVHCQAAFARHGAAVSTVNLGPPDFASSLHSGSGVAGTAQVVRWFTQLTH